MKELLNIFNYTILSAERFFLAAVKNSHFCTTHFDTNLRTISWQRKFGMGCHTNRPSVDWFGSKNSPDKSRGCSPVAYRKNRWNEIAESMSRHDRFLIRKFDSTIDMSVLNKIDMEIDGSEVPNKFWLNIWHHK